jgi:hypothetical protein
VDNISLLILSSDVIPASAKAAAKSGTLSYYAFYKIFPFFSLFHRAFQFTIYNGPTNALVCKKT